MGDDARDSFRPLRRSIDELHAPRFVGHRVLDAIGQVDDRESRLHELPRAGYTGSVPVRPAGCQPVEQAVGDRLILGAATLEARNAAHGAR